MSYRGDPQDIPGLLSWMMEQIRMLQADRAGTTWVQNPFTGGAPGEVYNLTANPVAGSVSVFVNGTRLREGTDYAISVGDRSVTLAAATTGADTIDITFVT